MKRIFNSYWLRSAFYTFLQRFSLTFFGLINFMVLIRSLTPSQMGTWALFLAVTTIFEMAKSNLLKNAHIRYVSTTDDTTHRSAIASSSFLINLMITVVFSLLLFFFAAPLSRWLNAGTDLSTMLLWFIPGLFGMVFFSHLEAIQQSHLDFKGVFAGYLARQTLFFLIILAHVLFKIPFEISRLAVYQSFCIVIGAGVLYWYCSPYLYYRFNPSRSWTRRIFGYGGYIFSSGLMANLFSNLDQVMAARFMAPSSVAYYNAASRINSLVDIPSYAAAEILFPKTARASVEEGPARVKYLYERMVAVLMAFTTPAAIFIILVPGLVISLIAGKQYLAAAPILQLYMITGILRPMLNQAANLLNSIGKQSLCFWINAGSLGANLVINYYCLRHFGFYGAAIGTLITCVLGSILWYFVMRKQINARLSNILRYGFDFYKSLYNQLSTRSGKSKEVKSTAAKQEELIHENRTLDPGP